MNKSSWLIYVYIGVGIIIISSLLYSFDFSIKDIKSLGGTPKADDSQTSKTDSKSNSGKNVVKQTHVLELGKSKTIKGINYLFSRVSSDTRCPDAEKCAEPGKAEVDLLIGGAGAMETVSLNTAGPTTYANLSIEIKSLTPIPVSSKETIELTFEVAETE